jgi:transmembrane 9 superfamily protein 3
MPSQPRRIAGIAGRVGAAVATVLLFVGSPAAADEHTHGYNPTEEVILWMNTVGPYHNRQETYSFFTLPFCKGPKTEIGHHHESLGEALQGVELEFSGLDIKFGDDVAPQEFCHVTLDAPKFKAFQYAVKHHYWYQMYIDDMPMWALVGDHGDGHDDGKDAGKDTYLWTHKRFDIGVNGNQIVDVNLTTGKRTKLEQGATIRFTYQINWKQSDVPFSKRYEKYLDPQFFQHRIHWFSIFNSFMMVLFLVGIVTIILMRTIRMDYARYSREDDLDDMERDLGDEYGWKQVHGDVFRAPAYNLLFSTLVGTGYQVTVVSFIVIMFSIMGDLYVGRGSIVTTVIFVYAGCAPISGFFGGGLYARNSGEEWIKQVMTTAAFLPGFVCMTAFAVNFVAIYYHAARAIPFGTMMVILCIWIFVVLPLTLVGAVIGRNVAGTPDHPCRISPIPRPIPEKKWFMEPSVIVMIGGVLPFGSIFIEMYFIFTSFWAYKIYYVYGFMLLVFLILIIVTICVTIVCTYFLLNAEDYRWQWTSFLAAGSTSIYVYLYSIYYYLFKTKMSGMFQTSFYFSYMALMSLVLGIMCGTLGFAGSNIFVRKIYRNVKID